MEVINIQPHERWNYDLNQPPKTQMIRNLRQRCLPILSSASSLTSFPPHWFFVGLICDVLGVCIADAVLDPSATSTSCTTHSHPMSVQSQMVIVVDCSDRTMGLYYLNYAWLVRGVCVSSSKITCATQAAHNCIPACVSCERPRGCSGELQGSDNGNLLLKPCWVCANVVFSTLGTCLTQAAQNCKPASKTCENSVCYSAELQGSDYGN